jgi:hypothetical protein
MEIESYEEAKKKIKLTRAERMKEWRKANAEHVRNYSKKYNKENVQRNRENRKKWMEANPDYYTLRYRERRGLVFEHYGQLCACCGESNKEFLTIDHIKGGGSKHREEIGPGLYEWLIKNDFPEGFRTLCWNCNLSLGSYGYCPHQTEGKKT